MKHATQEERERAAAGKAWVRFREAFRELEKALDSYFNSEALAAAFAAVATMRRAFESGGVVEALGATTTAVRRAPAPARSARKRVAKEKEHSVPVRDSAFRILIRARGKKMNPTVLLARVRKARPSTTGRMLGQSLRTDPAGRFRRSGPPNVTWGLK